MKGFTQRMRTATEKAIHATVIDRWRKLGFPNTLVATIPNAGAFGQAGLHRGLFDLVVIGGDVGVGFMELKAPTGKLSEHQEYFRDLLIVTGVKHAITYGPDQPVRVLEEWGIVRKEMA